MAKFKPARSKKAPSRRAADIRGALPCLVVVLGAIVVFLLIFYLSLRSSAQ